MTDLLEAIMQRGREDLVRSEVQRLHHSTSPHYGRLDPGQLQERAAALVDAFLASVATRPAAFTDHITRITEERIAEGYFLAEIQSALSILEEGAWQLVVQQSAPADQVGQLSRITSIIGAAKDQLARVYLEHLERAESRASRLQRRLDQLFKGTDERPLLQDEES
jgi:hypothetical protein